MLSGAGYETGCYVKPCIIEAENHYAIVQHETFAPILYVMKYRGDVHQAIAIQNGVPQGLSSAIMSNDLKEAEAFLSQAGSDCGIANVNIGTSGAEIGGMPLFRLDFARFRAAHRCAATAPRGPRPPDRAVPARLRGLRTDRGDRGASTDR